MLPIPLLPVSRIVHYCRCLSIGRRLRKDDVSMAPVQRHSLHGIAPLTWCRSFPKHPPQAHQYCQAGA
jgi:hypothetical protein